MVKAIVKTRFRCEVCKTDFKSKKSAEKCEARPLEKRLKFAGVGKKVNSAFWCMECDKKFTTGKIDRVEGPSIPDEELEIKWIRKSGRLNLHVYYYLIEAKCPQCKTKLHFIKSRPEIKK